MKAAQAGELPRHGPPHAAHLDVVQGGEAVGVAVVAARGAVRTGMHAILLAGGGWAKLPAQCMQGKIQRGDWDPVAQGNCV